MHSLQDGYVATKYFISWCGAERKLHRVLNVFLVRWLCNKNFFRFCHCSIGNTFLNLKITFIFISYLIKIIGGATKQSYSYPKYKNVIYLLEHLLYKTFLLAIISYMTRPWFSYVIKMLQIKYARNKSRYIRELITNFRLWNTLYTSS